jgi:hypothetical protein
MQSSGLVLFFSSPSDAEKVSALHCWHLKNMIQISVLPKF